MYRRLRNRKAPKQILLFIALFFAIGSPRPLFHSHDALSIDLRNELALHIYRVHEELEASHSEWHFHWILGGADAIFDSLLCSLDGQIVCPSHSTDLHWAGEMAQFSVASDLLHAKELWPRQSNADGAFVDRPHAAGSFSMEISILRC